MPSSPLIDRNDALRLTGLLLCVAFYACADTQPTPEPRLSAGRATVFDTTRDAFSLPIAGLSNEHRRAFFVGNSFFNQNWIEAPASVDSRDGLGPLFNARSCSGCHFKDGRGRPPEPGEPLVSMLVRVSVAGRGPLGAPVPHPIYGDQIQGQALPGVEPEAVVTIDYEPVQGSYSNGEPYTLRAPRYRLVQYADVAPSEPVLLSPRVAPALVGLGLLEAVPEAAVRVLADEADRNADGISGRPNEVWDVRKQRRVMGRFGWKAEQPTVEQQSAGAFAGDMGLTSTLFPRENHSETQQPRLLGPSGGEPEVSDAILRDVVLYARTLAVPAPRDLNGALRALGERMFQQAGCPGCHVPTLTTADSLDVADLSAQEFHPYTDLLLHDMGEGLSDARPSYVAEGSEWRTAPLWGLGLYPKVNGHALLLHDGRARGVAEAILWHGGEALAARRAYMGMSADERGALVAFVEAL